MFELLPEPLEVEGHRLESIEVDDHRVAIHLDVEREVGRIEVEVRVIEVEVKIKIEVEVMIEVEFEVVIHVVRPNANTLADPFRALLRALGPLARTLRPLLRTLLELTNPDRADVVRTGLCGRDSRLRLFDRSLNPLDLHVRQLDRSRASAVFDTKVGRHDDGTIASVERHDHTLWFDSIDLMELGRALTHLDLLAAPVRQQERRASGKGRAPNDHGYRKRVRAELVHTPPLHGISHLYLLTRNPGKRLRPESYTWLEEMPTSADPSPKAGCTFSVHSTGRTSPAREPLLEMTMRSLALLGLLTVVAAPATAQLTPPSDLAAVEVRRSQRCVTVIDQVRQLDSELAPFASRRMRLQAIAEAVNIEDPSVVASLDRADPTEGAVVAWFSTDQLLAQRFVETGVEALQQERSTGRQTILRTIGEAALRVQEQADSVLDENQETVLAAGPCDGAVFVRPAVVEACGDRDAPICQAARDPEAPPTGFLFVDNPDSLWAMRDLRPWTTPTGLAMGAGGLDGGRTIGYARVGNVVVTVALSPILRQSEDVTPAERFRYDQTNQALGFIFDHPTIAFAPGFGMRAALPEPLAGEDEYLIHFGDPTDPDVVWRGEAGTGAALEATMPMSAGHILRLRNGEALSLTAVRGDDPRYTISLDTAGQAEAASALVTYMSSQLSVDLNELVRGGSG